MTLYPTDQAYPTMPHTSSRPIRFVFRAQPVEVALTDPTRSVLQWLREDVQACGTKEGCAEGDCGACTVLVAELDPQAGPDGVRVRPINACIRFLPTLDGKALLTVEDLHTGGQPHPAQQAMVNCHGSQCGFCTPGFMMTLAAVHQHHQHAGTRPARAELADALAGNLCRCTGYRPIVEAGQQMMDLPGPGLNLAAVAQGLRQLQAEEASPLQHPGLYHAPRDLASLAALRLARPQARLLAGGTDIGLWVTKQFRPLGELIWLGEVAELHTLAEQDGWLHIGAAVPLQDAWSALAQRWPALTDMGRRFAGPPVRHAGTLCGNLANGSPIGDSAPVLMALGAELWLRRGEQCRRLPLEAFYLDYMKNQLAEGEFIEAVRLPLDSANPAQGWCLRADKISKRFDCDISALSAGLAIRLENGRVAEARLAFGGMAATVRRARHAEAAWQGQPWSEASLRQAQAALVHDFQPLSDLRASAGYRRQVAAALLERLWLAHRPDHPLTDAELSVFA